MPDAWEVQYGLNPDNPADALLDKDGDGLRNVEEYLAGTSPTNPSSTLALQISRGGVITLQFQAVADKSYTIEFANSLASDAWLPLVHIEPRPGPALIEVTDSSAGATRFYRIRSPRLP